MNDNPKPYETGGPGDHHPNERSISGRACLPLLLAMVGLPLVIALVIIGAVQADATPRTVKTWHTRTIYVTETLPKGYDVNRAVEVWDNQTRLNLVLVKRCPTGKRCISFTAGKRPGSALASTWTWQTSTGIDHCDVVIDTRKLGKLTSGQRLGTLAHETGHCLGFAHDDDRHSVMYRYNTTKRPWKPNNAQYSALARTYGK